MLLVSLILLFLPSSVPLSNLSSFCSSIQGRRFGSTRLFASRRSILQKIAPVAVAAPFGASLLAVAPHGAFAINLSALAKDRKGRLLPAPGKTKYRDEFEENNPSDAGNDNDESEKGDTDTVEINGVTYSTKLQSTTKGDDGVSFEIPSKWEEVDGHFMFAGQEIVSKIEVHTVTLPPETPLSKLTTVSSIVSLLHLGASESSDVVAASRVGDFYEWDLAESPKTCSKESEGLQNFGALGICPYDTVHLVRAVQSESGTKVLEIKIPRAGWLIANSEARSVRRSMKVQ